jgi:hypothetical protein
MQGKRIFSMVVHIWAGFWAVLTAAGLIEGAIARHMGRRPFRIRNVDVVAVDRHGDRPI